MTSNLFNLKVFRFRREGYDSAIFKKNDKMINPHELKAAQLKANGIKIFFINDKNDEIYASGFAEYLMNKYEYINRKHHATVYLNKPKQWKQKSISKN